MPWSPLHKQWPEVFLDAPHQILPGKELPVFLLVKDADLYPVRIHTVKIQITDQAGTKLEEDFPVQLDCDRNLQYQIFRIPIQDLKQAIHIQGWVTAENRQGKTITWINHNFPGIASRPLETQLLRHALPYANNWAAGEMHCHSEFSSDPVEFGAPLALLQQAADAVGLDFVLCTDHSYDFYYRRERYLEPCDPTLNFSDYRDQARALNAANPSLPRIIPGEEVSCGNFKGENVHLLVFGHERFLPGLGDGGRRGFKNHPDLSLAETLEQLNGTPSFAAHPKAQIGWLERKIFRRGQWHDADVASRHPTSPPEIGIRGLQFWNGNLGRDYQAGKAFWISRLLAGQKLLPIGANDAHGDFNQNIGVKFPMLSLYQGRNHVFGKVRTVVPAAGKTSEALRRSFSSDQCLCTDGPFASLACDDKIIQIRVMSNSDFGGLRSVTLYAGRTGEENETRLREWVFDQAPMQLNETCDRPAWVDGYVRAEVLTQSGRRALTSALFLKPSEGST